MAQPAAHYFMRRPLLPRQQHRAEEQGGLLVTAHISHIDQLLPVLASAGAHSRAYDLAASLRQTLAQWEE